ncbi:MAG: hypothetical protein GC193_12605 [Cryomorphaceae bacterium]|nr:hypothetical protein [Cryomorphaceae bacterium]
MPNTTTHLTQTSVDIYGAARLGAASLVREVSAVLSNITFVGVPVYDSSVIDQRIASANYALSQLPVEPAVHARWLGYKQYELSNHPARVGHVLGNVTATLSDAKSTQFDGAVHYTPRITSLTDYYPFGAAMPGRSFSEGEYRYGYWFLYQGSEKENESAGDANVYSTFYRMLDVRVGRWLSVDPVLHPWQSTYTSMDNNPVLYNDPMGDKIRGNLKGVVRFYKQYFELTRLQKELSSKSLQDTPRARDVAAQVRAMEDLRGSDVIFAFVAEHKTGGSKSPRNQQFSVQVDQRKSAFAGDRVGRLKITFYNGDNYEGVLASGIAKAHSFENGELDMLENPSRPYSYDGGHIYDSPDVRKISEFRTFWEYGADQVNERIDAIEKDVDRAIQSGKSPNQLRLETPAGQNDDPPLDDDAPTEYNRESNIDRSTAKSWVRGKEEIELKGRER